MHGCLQLLCVFIGLVMAEHTFSQEEKKKKQGKENAFHIEELPNANSIYDKESWIKPDLGSTDLICSIAAGPESFIIGR
jgi:hypothetical protein